MFCNQNFICIYFNINNQSPRFLLILHRIYPVKTRYSCQEKSKDPSLQLLLLGQNGGSATHLPRKSRVRDRPSVFDIRCLQFPGIKHMQSSGCVFSGGRVPHSHHSQLPYSTFPHVLSHHCAYEDKLRAQTFYHLLKQDGHFSIMLHSVMKVLGSECNMKSFLPHQQTDGERHSSSFPAFCLWSIFGISFRKLEVVT